MSMHRAACQCGQLSAKFEGDPEFVVVCTCKACQRRTGALFGTGAYFRKTQMDGSGTSKRWQRIAPTGRKLVNHFCPDCGTTLYWTLEMRPDHVGAAFGTFETDLPDPARVIWTEQKHAWIGFPGDMPSYPTGSPEPGR